jgi:hypothetical protein
MRVHFPRLTLNRFVDIPVDEFARLARVDRFGEHLLTDNPDESDLIIFSQCHMLPTDWRLTAIRDHPLTMRHRDKVMVYDERDRPWCVIPGLYVSMPSQGFDRRFQRAAGYFRFPDIVVPRAEPDLLFSFIGSSTANCRQRLFELRHPDAVIEKVRRFTHFDPTSYKFEERRLRFHDVMARSRFVLCPRGRGTSSLRLHETLAAGRIPVIISDEWVDPEGPEWESFSIRWPEGTIKGLVETLEERDSDWNAMSAAALVAHETFFAPEVSFHRVVERCRDLQDSVELSRFPRRGIRNRAFLAAGASVTRWRTTTSVRRSGKRVLRRLGFV